MQDPREEIVSVVHDLTTTSSPDIQLRTLERYYTSDAAFDHPVARVRSSPHSREGIIGLYQIYRALSPTVELKVTRVAYDDQTHTIFLDCVQIFHIFLSPFAPKPAHLAVKLDLQLDHEGLYRIKKQTDYYQPEEFANLTFPFLAGPIVVMKLVSTLMGRASAAVFQKTLGWWKPGASPSLEWARKDWFWKRTPVALAKET